MVLFETVAKQILEHCGLQEALCSACQRNVHNARPWTGSSILSNQISFQYCKWWGITHTNPRAQVKESICVCVVCMYVYTCVFLEVELRSWLFYETQQLSLQKNIFLVSSNPSSLLPFLTHPSNFKLANLQWPFFSHMDKLLSNDFSC